MSLAVTPAYDPDAVAPCGDHAVVVGGSVAGLLAARVLDDAFARVTVVDRDAPPGDIPLYCASRPLLEHHLHERVLARDGVARRDGCRVTDYLTTGTAVTGVALRSGAGERESLPADLVVDATGRASRTPSWLADSGYAAPPEDDVRVDLAYSTVRLDRPPADERSVLVAPGPPRPRGAALFPVEGDEWLLTAFGLHDETPPRTVAGVREWAASLPPDSLARVARDHDAVADEVAHYPFPSSRRRRYWALDRHPGGLLVVGDAVASFNPIYGRGMSVAALEACHLSAALADGRDGLVPRFFDRIEPVVADAWALAVGSDFRFPATTGPKPRGTDLLNRYMSRLVRTAHGDGAVSEAYARVATMERRPVSVLRPGVAWRVLRPGLGG
jgi:2-polyprenyl-6-methoxyphenol hydroxylase-like FAD-dependent oxidoreductase